MNYELIYFVLISLIIEKIKFEMYYRHSQISVVRCIIKKKIEFQKTCDYLNFIAFSDREV